MTSIINARGAAPPHRFGDARRSLATKSPPGEGGPPPPARARGRRFAALPSGPSREPPALLIQRLLSSHQYPSTTDSVFPPEAGSWKLAAGYPNHRTSAAVANRFNTAAGNSHFQPNSINWS